MFHTVVDKLSSQIDCMEGDCLDRKFFLKNIFCVLSRDCLIERREFIQLLLSLEVYSLLNGDYPDMKKIKGFGILA